LNVYFKILIEVICFVSVPAILGEAVPSTIDNIQNEYNNISAAIFDFIAILEHSNELHKFEVEVDLDKVRDVQINGRQHEAFLSLLLSDVKNCKYQIESLQSQYASRMDALKETVASKTAVPTSQVYPQFINLAHIWTSFQDEMVLLSVLSNIFASLDQFRKTRHSMLDEDVLEKLSQNIEVKTDDERIKETSSEQHRILPSRLANKDIDILFPETTKNFEKLPIQYRVIH